MAKYAKYLILIVLVLICILLIWYVFIRQNDEVTEYMNKFQQAKQTVQGNVEKEHQNIPPINDDEPDDVQEPIDNDKVIPPPNEKIDDDAPGVILTSETEMLNKQGEELLKQISNELENSILTIKQSTGVVDSEILNINQEL